MAKYNDATLTFFEQISGQAVKSTNEDVITSISAKSNFEKVAAGKDIELTEDMSVLKLNDYLFSKFNDEWIDWLPEALNVTLFGKNRDDVLTDKIQALSVCHKTDAPWTEWDIFENVGKAFNHQKPTFNIIQPLTLGECAVTAELMSKIRPEEEFWDEVLSYIGVVAATENYTYIPEELLISKAQKYLDKFVHDKDVFSELKELWPKLKGRPLLEANYMEDKLLHQQIIKLAILEQYVKENTNA